jgi:viologen exporter family transport system permease protein
MRYLRLVGRFAASSAQNEMAYRASFWISLLHSLLNLGTGVLGVVVLFGQVESLRGWTLPSALALLGVYLTLSALRRLFIGPSLESLSGLDGEIHTGRFDFTLLRPLDVQFQASFRSWRPMALLDLVLGLGVLVAAVFRLEGALAWSNVCAFAVALAAGLVILYAILLAFTGLVFWSPGFLFTWVFNGIFQMARYPVGLYPGWLRLVLIWVVPIGVMTTLPAQALTAQVSAGMLVGSVVLAVAFLGGATVLFRAGLGRYTSASS